VSAPLRIVGVDGPAGSGKSTITRLVAVALDLEVLDTGAMYRVVTLAALESGTALDDGPALGALARRHRIGLGPADAVTLDGRDVRAEIRGPEVTGAVSTVSAQPEVREVLVDLQRAWMAERGGGVVEGRDITTVVFPDAPLKVYLTASEAERARRRAADEAAADRPADAAAVEADLKRRDALDSGRAAAPLAVADDAVVLDTTGLTIDDVVGEVVRLAHRAFTGGDA